jgi:hypothetical protein
MSSGVRVLWLGIASGWCPVEWCFLNCQNCFIKRTHWAHPVWTLKILALRRRALARGAGTLRTGLIRHFEIALRLATPDIRLASADAFAAVGGGCTGRAHGCKAKQGRRGKDGADVWYLLPQYYGFRMASRAGEELFGNRHRAITCQADLEVFREGQAAQQFRNRDGRQSEFTFAGEHLRA